MDGQVGWGWRGRLAVYGRLMRVDRPIGTLLLLWPTLWALFWAAGGWPGWNLLVVFAAGTFLMRSAGCVANDLADRDFDGAVRRTAGRPFARGEVKVWEAVVLTAGLCLAAAFCLLPLNGLAVGLSLPAVFLALTYPYTKRFFPLPQLYLGLAFSFGIPMAFAAVQGAVPGAAWVMFAANVCWTLAYDTVYAMVDKEDDVKIGICTAAVTFGDYDKEAVLLFHVAASVLMAVLGWLGAAVWPYWAMWAVVLGMQLRQYCQIVDRDREVCFAVFLANNRIGMLWFVGVWLGVAV